MKFIKRKKKNWTEAETELEKPVDDDHDVKRHILQVHDPVGKKVISNDIVLAVLEEKERKFCIDQIRVANDIMTNRSLIRDPKIAEVCARSLLIDVLSVCVTKRNVKGNPILDVVLRPADMASPPEEEDLDSKIREVVKKKKGDTE